MFSFFPSHPDKNCHWAYYHRGHIVLRNDSATNLNTELYREFALPYDAALLKHFGGGVVHFCGRGDHYISCLCEVPELTAINMTQPHLNNMEIIYRNTVDKGIPLLAFLREYAEKTVGRENGFLHNMHCVQ